MKSKQRSDRRGFEAGHEIFFAKFGDRTDSRGVKEEVRLRKCCTFATLDFFIGVVICLIRYAYQERLIFQCIAEETFDVL